MPTPKFTKQDVDQLSAWFQRRHEAQFAWKSAISAALGATGLRGLWPMSAIDYTNPQVTDLSGHGYDLTNNNVALFEYSGLTFYATFDGVNQYFSRADGGAANWADITGLETYISPADRGLTIGGWFYSLDIAASILIGKIGAAGQRSYWIQQTNTTTDFQISVDGTAVVSVSDAIAPAAAWRFIVGRFDPSAATYINVNERQTQNVAAIPASIFDSTSSFTIAATSLGGTNFHGTASLCFVCTSFLSDVIVRTLFEQSKALFGVK